MKRWLRVLFAGRPTWMNVLMVFCGFMAFVAFGYSLRDALGPGAGPAAAALRSSFCVQSYFFHWAANSVTLSKQFS